MGLAGLRYGGLHGLLGVRDTLEDLRDNEKMVEWAEDVEL